MARNIHRIASEIGTVRTFNGLTVAHFRVSSASIVGDLFQVIQWLGSLEDGCYLQFKGPDIDYQPGDTIAVVQRKLWNRIPTRYYTWFEAMEVETRDLFFEIRQ